MEFEVSGLYHFFLQKFNKKVSKEDICLKHYYFAVSTFSRIWYFLLMLFLRLNLLELGFLCNCNPGKVKVAHAWIMPYIFWTKHNHGEKLCALTQWRKINSDDAMMTSLHMLSLWYVSQVLQKLHFSLSESQHLLKTINKCFLSLFKCH